MNELKKPQETDENVNNAANLRFVKEITDEIETCDKIIENAEINYKKALEKAAKEREHIMQTVEVKRKELRKKFQNAIVKIQSRYGLVPRENVIKHNNSVRALITDYLEKHRQAKTSEIRSFLQNQGKMTNPGVELYRMVRDGSIVNKERGVYKLNSRSDN